MRYAFLTSTLRRLLPLGLAVLLTSGTWGQQTDQQGAQLPPAPQTQPPTAVPVETSQSPRFLSQDFTKPRGYFPNPIAPCLAHSVPAPNLSNSPRVNDLLRDGKLYISMDDAVALALENNLDIVIQRYNLSIADTDILRAKAGPALWVLTAASFRTRPAAAWDRWAARWVPGKAEHLWQRAGLVLEPAAWFCRPSAAGRRSRALIPS